MRFVRANVLTAIFLVSLLVLVVVSAPRWTRLLSRPVPGDESGEEAATGPREVEDAATAEGQISVKLFFQAADQPALLMEERSVAYSADLSRQLAIVVEEIIRGPKTGLLPTLAPGGKVLDVFVSSRGVAYVDLSKEVAAGHPGGTRAELLSVYSVVNSLTTNFPAVRRVQILVDDRPAPTLVGHVDLLRPLSPDMTLLVGSAPSPVPLPSAALPAPSPKAP